MSRIYPAIDLMKGQVVRLAQGAFDQVSQYHLDPLEVARSYEAAGATYLHIVDLDGARCPGERQLDLIQKIIAATKLKVQTGGGIRSYDDVKRLLESGVDRVIIGTLAIKDPETTQKIIQKVTPARVTLGIDAKQDKAGLWRVATDGWRLFSNQTVQMVLDFYRPLGIEVVLCTDISRDGMGSGPNFELYAELMKRYPEIGFLASGGVGGMSDIVESKRRELFGIIIGKALYQKKVDLKEALLC